MRELWPVCNRYAVDALMFVRYGLWKSLMGTIRVFRLVPPGKGNMLLHVVHAVQDEGARCHCLKEGEDLWGEVEPWYPHTYAG
jgi:hypothetical protein